MAQKIKAIELLNYKTPKPKKKEPQNKLIKRRKKRSIFEIQEEPMKMLTLRFLSRRFQYPAKENLQVGETKFFELMMNFINGVQIKDTKITFLWDSKKVVAVNFNILKGKYKDQVVSILKTIEVGTDGIIRTRKTVHDIMVICQTCYARGNHHDRFRMVDKSEIPQEVRRVQLPASL